jgi:hypothetical protein
MPARFQGDPVKVIYRQDGCIDFLSTKAIHEGTALTPEELMQVLSEDDTWSDLDNYSNPSGHSYDYDDPRYDDYTDADRDEFECEMMRQELVRELAPFFEKEGSA